MDEENPYASPAGELLPAREVDRLEPPQTVEFDFKPEDYEAFNAFLWVINPALARHTRRRQIAMFSIAGVFLLVGLALYQQSGTAHIAPFAAAAAMGFLAFRYPRRIQRSGLKLGNKMLEEGQNRDVFSLKRLTIDEQWVTQEDESSRSAQRWWAVEGVHKTDTHLFVFLSAATAFVIPARAFLDEPGFKAFADLAERLWKQGVGKRSMASRN